MQTNIRYGYVKRYIIEPILKRFGIPNAYWKYYIAYYIEGTMAIIKEWLNNDCQDSIETMATVIEECIRPFKGASGELDSEKYSTWKKAIAYKKTENRLWEVLLCLLR